MNLSSKTFRDASRISVTFASPQEGRQTIDEVLVVQFDGEYRRGSAGNQDAGYMCGLILAGIYTWVPSGLVLDFRRLSYTWGDQMSLVLHAGRQSRRLNLDRVLLQGGPVEFQELPTVVVSSERNYDGLASLITDLLKEDVSEWLFSSLEEAVAALLQRLRVT